MSVKIILSFIFGLFLSSVIDSSFPINTGSGTPQWVIDIINQWQRNYSKISATAAAFSNAYYSANATAAAFSNTAAACSNAYHIANATADAYKCELDDVECQPLLRQSVVYYENNLIEVNTNFLRIKFPDMDESFFLRQNEYKMKKGEHAMEVLARYGKRYNPATDDIEDITTDSTENVGLENPPSTKKVNLNNRRLLKWISFLDGVESCTIYKPLNRNGILNVHKVVATPPRNEYLRVWWFVLRRFGHRGFETINVARFIIYNMKIANAHAHNPFFESPYIRNKMLRNLRKCIVGLVKKFTIPVLNEPPTDPFSLEILEQINTTTSIPSTTIDYWDGVYDFKKYDYYGGQVYKKDDYENYSNITD